MQEAENNRQVSRRISSNPARAVAAFLFVIALGSQSSLFCKNAHPRNATPYARMCVLAQTQPLLRVTLLLPTQQNLVKEESNDVVDNFSDTAGTLVSGFPGAFWWQPDTSPARHSSDRPGV